MALVSLAADASLGATAGLINKKTAVAIGLARPHDPKGGPFKVAPRNGIAGAPTNAGSQNVGGGAAAVAARNAPNLNAATVPGTNAPVGAGTGTGTGTVKNVSVAAPAPAPQATGSGPAGPTGSIGQTGSTMKSSVLVPATKPSPPPGPAAHDGVIGGAGTNHSTSMLAAVGGPATVKGTAVINGTSMPPRRH